MKTKNFHWHMTGRYFRDYPLLLEEHAAPLFEMTDRIAERARKIGGTTLRSIADIARHQRLQDVDDESISPRKMLMLLRRDNLQLTGYMRSAHELCAKHGDFDTTSLLETWIDRAQRRSWFLAEVVSEN